MIACPDHISIQFESECEREDINQDHRSSDRALFADLILSCSTLDFAAGFGELISKDLSS